MKLKVKIGDIIFEGGKINGVETEFEFASIEEYRDYIAAQKETFEQVKNFLKVELPEIITGTADAFKIVSRAIGESIEESFTKPEIKTPITVPEGIKLEGLKDIESVIEGLLSGMKKPVQPVGISIKESPEVPAPKGFKIAEKQAEEGTGVSHTDKQIFKFSEYYKEK